jgi:hypothetical protein
MITDDSEEPAASMFRGEWLFYTEDRCIWFLRNIGASLTNHKI